MQTPMPTSIQDLEKKVVKRMIGFAAFKIFTAVFISDLSKRMAKR